MATLQIFNACTEHNQELNRKSFKTSSFEPDLISLFGVKELVDKMELEGYSEIEKRRHFYEDAVLRFLYIEN